jgi:hypothetical protein
LKLIRFGYINILREIVENNYPFPPEFGRPQNPAMDESWQLRDLGIAVLNAFPTLSCILLKVRLTPNIIFGMGNTWVILRRNVMYVYSKKPHLDQLFHCQSFWI